MQSIWCLKKQENNLSFVKQKPGKFRIVMYSSFGISNQILNYKKARYLQWNLNNEKLNCYSTNYRNYLDSFEDCWKTRKLSW